MDRLFLIDGHALMFRMYYAFMRRPMINSKGTDVSVIFGFMKYLLELIRREKPTHLAVAFDPHCPTFRHEAYPPYKANRDASPEVVRDSLEPLIEMIRALDIPVLMVPGFEADDVIGSAAVRGEREGFDVYMVTPDKDFGQLITEHIIQYKPGKAGADNELVGVKEVCEKYGIASPRQVIDILALWGDTSDNVPGVRGVGEKGASKLVAQFGSVENIMANLEKLPPKQAEAFRSGAEQLKMSKFLVTIKTDVALDCCRDDLKVGTGDGMRIRELFREYEFASLKQLLPEGNDIPVETSSFRSVQFSDASVSEVADASRVRNAVGILRSACGSWCISAGGKVAVSGTTAALRAVMESDCVKVGFDLKGIMNALRKDGIALNGYLGDIELIHYLINPELSHKAEILCRGYLGLELESVAEERTASGDADSGELDLFSQLEERKVEVTAREKALCSILVELYGVIRKELAKDEAQVILYDEVEMPLIRVLSDMENEGFGLDTASLAAFGNELRGKIAAKEAEIREMAGEPSLNVLSPMRLGLVLFEKMKLDPKAKKSARGSYSTDEETLSSIADRHPIIPAILEYREMRKMMSTYVEPLPLLLSPADGKIHTTFNQSMTATGRLSSMKPNLQNIPVRSDMGKNVRKAFIPSRNGNLIVSADYSQIELRLMAALSGDAGLVEAFRENKDIHSATASRIFGKAEAEITREERSRAKTANFGIIYGISAFGLSQRLGIPQSESKALIDEYFVQYPGVRAYIERMKEKAREEGCVETMFHRKRYLPNINSRNHAVRSLAERNAINAPIQGSAADIIKVAMVRMADRLRKEGLAAKMILQVHDELVFDVPENEVDRVCSLAREEMEGVIDLGFPLTVECGVGENWLEAH